MRSSSASLTACQLCSWLYVGTLLLVGGGALAAFGATLFRIATELSRAALAPLTF